MRERHTVEKLPESLQTRFESLRARLRAVESVRTVCVSVVGALSAFIVFFLLERAINSPSNLRFGLFLGSLFIIWSAIYQWYLKWIRHPRDARLLSRTAQKRFPRLGDRLLGIVELANTSETSPKYSPEILKAAVNQVAEESEGYDFREAAPWNPVRRWIGAAVGTLIGAGLIHGLFPNAAANAWTRLAMPWASIDRYTLTSIKDLPESLITPHGEPYQISGEIARQSAWSPKKMSIRIDGVRYESISVENHQFLAELPAATQPTTVRLKIGDTWDTIEITPTHRPALEDLVTKQFYPDYLEYEPAEFPARDGRITTLQGSRSSFRGTITADLDSVEMRVEDQAWIPIEPQGASFETPLLDLDNAFQLQFRWTGANGLDAASNWPLLIDHATDEPPTIAVEGLPAQAAILVTDVLTIQTIARDDYGVKEVSLRLEAPAEDPEAAPEPLVDPIVSTAATSNETEFRPEISVSPQLLGLEPGATILVRAGAIDYFPNRDPVYSTTYALTIIGIESHAEAVRQGLEALMSRVEDVTRAQEEILNLNQDVLDSTDVDDLDSEMAKSLMENLESLQARNARDLESMAQRGQELLREALRNPSIDETAAMEWSENLTQMNSIAENEMAQARSQIQEARQSASNQSQSEAQQSLEDAMASEQSAIEQLTDLQQSVNQDLDNLQALTLSQRLRGASRDEENVTKDLKEIALRTLGMRPGELSTKYQTRNERVGDRHEAVKETAISLGEEINRFAERTKIDRYVEVSESIKESELGPKLTSVTDLIESNVSMRALTQTDRWSNQFTEWADILDPEPEEGSSGGEGGEGGQSGDDNTMEQLVKLLRTRESEIEIQKKTRSMIQLGLEDAQLRNATQTLSKDQLSLSSDVEEITLDNRVAMLHPVLRQTGDTMRAIATRLGVSDVGTETDAQQTVSVELLTDAINILNESSNQQGSQASASQSQSTQEQMAFLMQMMSQSSTPSANPGAQGNPSQYGFDGENSATLVGDATGSEGESRRVEQSSGAIQSFPTEFRDALQRYFDSIENEN